MCLTSGLVCRCVAFPHMCMRNDQPLFARMILSDVLSVHSVPPLRVELSLQCIKKHPISPNLGSTNSCRTTNEKRKRAAHAAYDRGTRDRTARSELRTRIQRARRRAQLGAQPYSLFVGASSEVRRCKFDGVSYSIGCFRPSVISAYDTWF